ncbi:hypothetical protein AB9K26_07015 [Psychroserpens sp. XS_ASV72]|uniref:hypothetical protein n=1 Tax=Psychroserpens sp. XS_ASV72 TaxID=3241293 RepID=UPI00351295B8
MVYLSLFETKKTFATCKILSVDDITRTDFKEFDSVTVAANLLYEASFLKEIMQGEQYRDAWSTPVTVPIVFLDTLKGGMRIVKEGGGNQTHSIKIADSKGVLYTLRSLSKNPEPLIPEIAEDLHLENIVVDGVSAQHPYAALLVAQLADAVDVLHTQPQLVFVPEQEALGDYNKKYGNRLYYLEYESEGPVNWTRLTNVKELIDTDDLLELQNKKEVPVILNKNALIRARLFDNIIGDWDRHAKQWGWAIQEHNGISTATPIPTDRDNAFFKGDGIIPTLITNDSFHPEVQSFDSEKVFDEGLVSKFDIYFLRNTTLAQFTDEAQQLSQLLTNEAIDNAFKIWPATIDSLDGKMLRDQIKHRRNNIVNTAAQFYKTIQAQPKEELTLKGCEDVPLEGLMRYCFDCNQLLEKL